VMKSFDLQSPKAANVVHMYSRCRTIDKPKQVPILG